MTVCVALTGQKPLHHNYPGRCPGLPCVAPLGRKAPGILFKEQRIKRNREGVDPWSDSKQNHPRKTPYKAKKQFDADLSQKPSRAPDDDHDLHHQIGNQASMRLSDGTILQPKLTVSQPDDPLEKEADRIADEVMRMPDLLHKEDDSSPIKGMDTKIHSFGRGHPIPKHELDFFESRFNQDFSEVRLHNNGHANKFAESLNAKALTAGRNIVFGPGQYQLESVKGKKLIAHELTHVVQQRASSFGDFNSNIKIGQ